MAEQIAKLNHLRMAPRKVRAVADIIRGLSVNEAEAQLLFQRRRASKVLLKLLRSAVANAKNKKMDPAKLVIGRISVDNASIMKRLMMRARGGASEIQKKSSHVTIVLTEVENPKERRFTIVTPKKARKPEGEAPRKKKAESKGGEEKGETKKSGKKASPGFFQKVFRRKSV